MKYANCILVPIDFSEDSRFAMETADRHAARCGSDLILLHVRKPAEHARTRMSIEENALERWVRWIEHTLKDRITVMTLPGDPVEVILQIAAQYQIRKIIMGRGGDAMRPGSVAEAVGRGFPGDFRTASVTHGDDFAHDAAA